MEGITEQSVGGWDNWGTLRKYNILLENVHKTKGSPTVINHYIGITRLMRAQWYYEMIKRFNEVPLVFHFIKIQYRSSLQRERQS